MSDKFTITKPDGLPWVLGYPDGFHDTFGGKYCRSFDAAVAAFIEASESRCYQCGKGAVVDTPIGWE